MGGEAYSTATAIELTGKDFEGCISAFNTITPSAKLVVSELTNGQIGVQKILSGAPVKGLAFTKEEIAKTNTDREYLKRILTRVFDELHFNE